MTIDAPVEAVVDWPARTFTIDADSGRPLTVNGVAKLHRQAWATHTRVVRQHWWLLARRAKVPRLDRISIVVTPLHKDGRSPQDVAACAPEVKAAIDGLVDAGVIADDGPRYLTHITFMPPLVTNLDGLRLEIREVSPCAT